MVSNISTQLPISFSPKTGVRPTVDGVSNASAPQNKETLSDEQKAQVAKLKKIDQEVQAHERAHKNAGGQYAGSATFSYQVGPDGQRYAVGGEVSIDVSPVENDPEATVAKLDVVIAAALAPAKPSAQDFKVAASAVSARNQAQAELFEKRKNEQINGQSDNNTFDVNDFGDVPPPSINKAYAVVSGLGIEDDLLGKIVSVKS